MNRRQKFSVLTEARTHFAGVGTRKAKLALNKLANHRCIRSGSASCAGGRGRKPDRKALFRRGLRGTHVLGSPLRSKVRQHRRPKRTRLQFGSALWCPVGRQGENSKPRGSLSADTSRLVSAREPSFQQLLKCSTEVAELKHLKTSLNFAPLHLKGIVHCGARYSMRGVTGFPRSEPGEAQRVPLPETKIRYSKGLYCLQLAPVQQATDRVTTL